MNSNAMELYGLQECVDFVEKQGLVVRVLVTDQHLQISSWLKKNKTETAHFIDLWHVAKGKYTTVNNNPQSNFK